MSCTAYDEPLDGKHVLVTLSAADGALLVRIEVWTIIAPNRPELPVTVVSDETVAYGPGDLTIARDGASVRVVNGVLRLGGSPAADDFRLYRSPTDPDQLIVEYNGYTRTFPFNSIRRIVADLQDGDDRLEIAEQTGGEFRLWTSVMGGGGADTIIGGGGNDFIRSRGNKDLVNGGASRDRITGGEGDDLLAGGGGHDSILAGSGIDVLFDLDAVGRLRLNGTPGPDRFRLHRPESDPTMLVVEVNDEARWIRRIIADFQDGNDFLEIVEAPGRDIRLWTSVLGGDGADTIIGGSGPDLIRSRGNADLIIGGGGRDRITSGQGDDVVSGGTGHDAILTNAGHDVLFGQNAVERVFGQLWEDGDEEEDLVLPGLF